MLQKSPVLTPSLQNLSYILRHREWWPDGFEWNYRYTDHCAIGLCQDLWHRRPTALHQDLRDSEMTHMPSEEYYRIFASRSGKTTWWKRMPWLYNRQMSSISPEQVADQIDRFMAKRTCHA